MLLSVLLLTGCAGSTKLDKPTVTMAAPGAYATRPCVSPAKIPDSATVAQVEVLWAGDRKSLVECKSSKAHVVNFFSKRDGRKY